MIKDILEAMREVFLQTIIALVIVGFIMVFISGIIKKEKIQPKKKQ